MTDLPSPAAPAGGPPSWWSGRRTSGFLTVCLLLFVLLAGWLYFFAPRQAPPGVRMTDLHGVADLRRGQAGAPAAKRGRASLTEAPQR
jgi:hypothetical protein